MTYTILQILIVIFFIFLTLILLFHTMLKQKRKIDDEEERNVMEYLEHQINQKQIRLMSLEKDIENRTYEKSVKLTKLENEILNIYEESNIRIPTDIIEEVHRMKLTDEKNLIDFIEKQRYYWKLENTKKPFIRK